MLIVPLSNKITWRNPPVATIGIILANTLIFLMFQSGQDTRYRQAMEYYFSSGLAAIEVQHYVADQDRQHRRPPLLREGESFDENELRIHFDEMQKDSRFLKRLENGQIISEQSPEYARWQALRGEYRQRLSAVTFIRYGFIPAHKEPLTCLTYMFLHGGVGHLIGNMIFLWIVGCMLEIGCGRLLYVALYLLTGLASAVFFGQIYADSTTPLVGASGAIAGLMGLFTVLYGRERVSIFFSLGFYFNYIRIPGIFLLPVWVGNELFQLFFSGVSQVAYVAHIGGLLAGSVCGGIVQKIPGILNSDIFETGERDDVSLLLEKALRRISDLDMAGGRQLLAQILDRNPGNATALRHLFNLDKQTPGDGRFHRTATRLLTLLCLKQPSHSEAHAVYREYTAISKTPRLPPELCVRLSTVFSGLGHPETAAPILSALLRKMPATPGMATALLKLSGACDIKGMKEQGLKCRQAICARYPDSPEARMIGDANRKK
ncbi:rhomboid family intramembrane serine protease [Desulfonema ishimotonii]|uniref:Rhomboid family intramembrane serine protease n=1 Tax=Desulfonema ishimotonii TaxID=45657 RepID=A0A401G1H5_9BACT|nr:rhomboid family intramembrane serine protease [Desulfonema ishimotonii]GBC63069.1 rhomboid family intramembrane serine protease [Desulfonema ishimotonii]